jgi:nicotinate phosphoribosyltransferase
MMASNSNDVASSARQYPTNSLVTPLLTDLYQITMTYAHWKMGKHMDPAVFEVFFRTNPFQGQFTICCGLDECIKYISTFSFSDDDILYLKSIPSLSHCEPGFFDYLTNLGMTRQLQMAALPEGCLVFPRVPMLTIRAPLGLGQLLETTLLNLVNYPSLIATNATRMVLRAQGIPCVEFGLRRAQGPDGAYSASKYSFVGGFTGTSNVQAGKLNSIPVWGTHAHAYVQSFESLTEVETLTLAYKTTTTVDQDEAVCAVTLLLPQALEYRTASGSVTNDGELAAFVAYACAFPDKFLCLVDTYDTLHSGLLNYTFVASVLIDMGYRPLGIRLDSGDLVALSLACRAKFQQLAAAAHQPSSAAEIWNGQMIAASNDLNEQVLQDLSTRPHGMTAFGIGTNLVTCQKQPALGCVYKLVECNGRPRIKLSQELAKVTLPGRKRIYRLYQTKEGDDGVSRKTPIADLLTLAEEPMPEPGQPIECCNPSTTKTTTQGDSQLTVTVTPSFIVELHSVMFEASEVIKPVASLMESREFVQEQLQTFPEEITRYHDPQEYPVYISTELYRYLHELWTKLSPTHQA